MVMAGVTIRTDPLASSKVRIRIQIAAEITLGWRLKALYHEIVYSVSFVFSGPLVTELAESCVLDGTGELIITRPFLDVQILVTSRAYLAVVSETVRELEKKASWAHSSPHSASIYLQFSLSKYSWRAVSLNVTLRPSFGILFTEKYQSYIVCCNSRVGSIQVIPIRQDASAWRAPLSCPFRDESTILLFNFSVMHGCLTHRFSHTS